MDRALFAEFRDTLHETLKDATYTKEIDVLVDSFLFTVADFLHFDSLELYIITDEALILRGIAGLSRKHVCQIKFDKTHECLANVLNKSESLVCDSINFSEHADFDGFSKMLVLPLGIFHRNFGILIARMRSETSESFLHEQSPWLTNLAGHFAIYVNALFETFRAEERSVRLSRIKEIDSRFEIEENFEEIMDGLAEDLAQIFDAKIVLVRTTDDNGDLVLRSAYGLDTSTLPKTITQSHILIRRIINDNGFSYSNNIENPLLKQSAPYLDHSYMSVLLTAFGKILGMVTLVDKTPSAVNPLGFFIEEDRTLFTNIGLQIAGRLYRARMLKLLERYVERIEKGNRKLYILYEVTNALLGQSKLEDILFILLTSATIGEAFGFNRAFLYLYDEKHKVFRGKMGVAPINEDDAYKIWNEIRMKNQEKSLMEKILVALGEKEIHENLELNFRLTKSILPADERCPLLHRLLCTKEPLNVHDPDARGVNVREFTDLFGDVPFALIPVISQKRLVGLLVVDNPYNKNNILEEDLDYFKMFANQTGIAIEYSFLYNEIEQRDRELKSTQQKLNEAQRLAIIGEMSSSIAHDLRNSIISIGGFASRLSRMDGLDEKVQHYAQIINNEVVKLEDYLRRNLSFAKKIKLNMEEIKAQKMVDMIQIIARERIRLSEKNIHLSVAIEEGVDSIVCDYTQMHDSILNLLVNAIDAIPAEGGEIRFIVRKHQSAMREANLIDIEIWNSNSYIERQDLRNIFDPFFTTKSSGIGLGLATAKRIIEAHGGEIKADSNKSTDGVYTSFTITIPKNHNAD